MRLIGDDSDETAGATATIEYRVESSRVTLIDTGIPKPSIRDIRAPATPIGSAGVPFQVPIVVSIADSAADNASCFAADAPLIRVSSIVARNTLARSAAMSSSERSSAASANPERAFNGPCF